MSDGAPDLDVWLPDARLRIVHRRDARADADALWRAAQTVHIGDAPTLGRMVRWRIPGTPADMAFAELFRRYPFTVLAEGERWSVSGLCGRIWTIRRDYPHLSSADEFLGWKTPGTARVLFGHWVEGTTLYSEARVHPVDRRAALRLRALWALVGHFEPLITREALRLVAQRAEGLSPPAVT